MAKPKEETGLAKTGDNGLAATLGAGFSELGFTKSQRPDFIPAGDKSGTEDIGAADLKLPRLNIAQGLSKEIIPGDSASIEGLRMFDMFNDVTKEVYGRGPIAFIVVRRDVRCIEFRDRKDGGGVVDLNVPRNDPRATQWREIDGKKLPPAATTFVEFLILILKEGGEVEPVLLSIKQTNKFNRNAAMDLTGFIKFHASRGAESVPIYGVIYSVSSKAESNDSGTFGVPSFKQLGYIPPSMPQLFERAREYYESTKELEIKVNRSADDSVAVDGEVMDADKVPF